MKWLSRVFRNEYIFALFSKVIFLVVTFAHSIVLARYFGSSLQGSYSYVQSVATVVSIVLTVGIHQAYPVLRKKYGKENIINEYVSFVVLLYVLLECVAVTLALVLSIDFIFKCIILLAPVFAYSRIISYLYLIERPNKNNLITLLISFVDLFCLIMFALFLKTQNFVFLYVLAFTDVSKSICFSLLIKFRFAYNKRGFECFGRALKIGIFPMIALLLTTLNYKLDVIMLKNYSTILLSEVGVYAIGISLAEKVVIIPDTLKNILVSHLTKGSDEKEVCSVCRISFVGSLIICASLAGLGFLLVPFIYGSEYADSATILAICCIGTCFIGFFKLIAQYFIVNNKQWINALFLAIVVVINFVINLILIPKWGIVGAAIGTSVSHFICGLLFVITFSFVSKSKITDIIFVKKEDFSLLKNFLKPAKKENAE